MTTKEALLKELEENRGRFISGSVIADKIGVSGTAVWKAAKRLQAEGYDIEAITNKGYRLAESTDVLSAREIQKCYTSTSSDRSYGPLYLEVFDTVESTNDICKNRSSRGQDEVYVAVASHQTRGRGRQGRNFFSPDETGLYMSILLRPRNVSSQDSLRYTTMTAVAVAEAIDELTGKRSSIKWVNDIMIDGRKVCGILSEASFNYETGSPDYIVIGIGVNVRQPRGGFPEDIRDIAGAVCSDGEIISRSMLAAKILRHFMQYYRSSSQHDYAADYRNRCYILGRRIKVIKGSGTPVSADAIDIDEECRLIVRYDDGTVETLGSGEISIR